jgi:hypothetical protein
MVENTLQKHVKRGENVTKNVVGATPLVYAEIVMGEFKRYIGVYEELLKEKKVERADISRMKKSISEIKTLLKGFNKNKNVFDRGKFAPDMENKLVFVDYLNKKYGVTHFDIKGMKINKLSVLFTVLGLSGHTIRNALGL